jgi:hypothetical protein
VKRSAPISAVIDLNTYELTAGYRRAVTAALPAAIEPADIWRDLAEAIAGYYTLLEHRPTKIELKRWRKIVALTNALDKEFRAMRTPGRTLKGDMAIRASLALCPIQDLAEAHVAGYQMINEAFQRRQNPHRQFLYGAVLDIWRRCIGRPLRFSRTESNHGMPRGPLIEFFKACVIPILGDEAPKVRGIATIIERARGDTVLKPRNKI